MGSQDVTDILLIGFDEKMSTCAFTAWEDFEISVCDDANSAIGIMMDRSIRVAVVACNLMENQGTLFLRHLRNVFFQEPVQIIAAVSGAGEAQKTLEYGADAFVVYPYTQEELRARLLAASVRLRSLIRICGESEFFRNAARQEEELSSKLLDQHLVLRESLQAEIKVNLELEETNKKLEKIARYDILSGLLNRATLFTAIDNEIERSLRSAAPLTGIMIDVDDFKKINDRFGHLHGDRVIAEIGRRLKSMLRRYDLAGRYGGEEFFIILPNSILRQAYSFAERFRKQMEGSSIELDGVATIITASFGVAQYRPEEARDAWIARCDGFLYQAKRKGRNCVAGE